MPTKGSRSGKEKKRSRTPRRTHRLQPEDQSASVERSVAEAQVTATAQTAVAAQPVPVEQVMPEQTAVTNEPAIRNKSTLAEGKTGKERPNDCIPNFRFLQPFAELHNQWWNDAKQVAAWAIDTSESLATRALDVQELATDWVKSTPWASFVHSQTILARRWVERSAGLARRWWHLEEEEGVIR